MHERRHGAKVITMTGRHWG